MNIEIICSTSETGGPSGPGRGGFGTNRPTPQNTGSMSSINTNTSNSAQFTGSGPRPPSSTSNHSSNISNSHSSSSLVRFQYTNQNFSPIIRYFENTYEMAILQNRNQRQLTNAAYIFFLSNTEIGCITYVSISLSSFFSLFILCHFLSSSHHDHHRSSVVEYQ